MALRAVLFLHKCNAKQDKNNKYSIPFCFIGINIDLFKKTEKCERKIRGFLHNHLNEKEQLSLILKGLIQGFLYL